MLDSIKSMIASQSDITFADFYQHYIVELEDSIIAHEMSRASTTFRSIEDISDIVKGINMLTEELK